ncbi:MAG: hypothetical protein K8I02_12225, partial [Candidatus Methylomirabilis sp.]|nr:hypothetical protein [Deltaproteobacteria bacterium]
RFAPSNVVLTNVTLAETTTLPFPGVPAATGSALTCSDCMDRFTLRNVIVSGSAAVPLCQGKFIGAMDTYPISLGGNVDSGATCGLTDPSDLSSADAALAALANNGGLTRTRALQAGSDALDAGATCPTNDQRGFVRGTETCDSGAYETLTPASATAFSCGGSYEGVVDQLDYIVEDLLPDAAANVGDVVFCLGGIAGNA